MPLEASTTDQPSTNSFKADTLAPNVRPALSATSDMPSFAQPEPEPKPADPAATAEPIDNAAEQDNAQPTSEPKPEGEADGEPTKTAGEEGDKTSPQQRAAFARERNRRQAAEQQTAELKAKIDQLTEAVSKLVPKTEPKEDPRPTRDKFDDPDAFDAALEGWATRRATAQALETAKAEQQKQDRDRQSQAQIETYKQRQSAFEADHPDFDEVMTDDLAITPAMTLAIMDAEDGPAIAYHLGQNPEMAERISKLSPALQAYEIGKISAKLAAPPPKPRAEPISPLRARNTAGPKSPDDMSMDEYAAWRTSKAN